jgi:hypothetical protein
VDEPAEIRSSEDLALSVSDKCDQRLLQGVTAIPTIQAFVDQLAKSMPDWKISF